MRDPKNNYPEKPEKLYLADNSIKAPKAFVYMLERPKIPFMLRLLDDESPWIRRKILGELMAEEELLHGLLHEPSNWLSSQDREALERLLDLRFRERFKDTWLHWRDESDEMAKLESALDSIAQLVGGVTKRGALASELDALAREFSESGARADAESLAHFLFRGCSIRGDSRHYYNPQNSNLLYVIRNRKGIPISLACILMLVGRRLGVQIHGFNLPGHFMAHAQLAGREVFIDCFNGGRLLDISEISSLVGVYSAKLNNQVHAIPTAEAIVGRFLRNLARAYKHSGNRTRYLYMLELLRDLRQKPEWADEEIYRRGKSG